MHRTEALALVIRILGREGSICKDLTRVSGQVPIDED